MLAPICAGCATHRHHCAGPRTSEVGKESKREGLLLSASPPLNFMRRRSSGVGGCVRGVKSGASASDAIKTTAPIVQLAKLARTTVVATPDAVTMAGLYGRTVGARAKDEESGTGTTKNQKDQHARAVRREYGQPRKVSYVAGFLLRNGVIRTLEE